jgi:hypothetical protein
MDRLNFIVLNGFVLQWLLSHMILLVKRTSSALPGWAQDQFVWRGSVCVKMASITYMASVTRVQVSTPER